MTWYYKAVTANKKNYEAQFGLGQIHIQNQDLVEAEKCFEICKNSPDVHNSFEVNRYLAYIYSRTKKKQFDLNIDMFKKALELKSEDSDCYLELAQLLEYKKPEESLKLYENLLHTIKSKQNGNINNLYNIQDILPEILNNIASIRIRLNLQTDVDKYLNDSLEQVKLQKEEIKKQVDNNDSSQSGVIEQKVIFEKCNL